MDEIKTLSNHAGGKQMKDKKIVGIGNTATIYEWEEGKVVKLFHRGYPRDAVEREFHNAMVIRDMKFNKPKAYEIVFCDECFGIVYDRGEGESLLDWVIRTGDAEKCATYMAKLHREILKNETSSVSNYKEFLKYHLLKTHSDSLSKQEEVLKLIDRLPAGNVLCHGDFHPGNILISGENIVVIDFMNICHGDYLYDVARTVFLLEYTPIPEEVTNKDVLIQFRKALADLYLMKMDVNRELIKDYLSVIIAARKGECPNE